ncbi:hypothetical protein GCM10009549_30980 [Streptomyces thermoalcalitolerans]|uniref:Uncharacterized protein n=1 Tax=Streptomyces thermoalcalitolerans TaxID=65605 RepID=A0ABP3Z9C6_9ACTN
MRVRGDRRGGYGGRRSRSTAGRASHGTEVRPGPRSGGETTPWQKGRGSSDGEEPRPCSGGHRHGAVSGRQYDEPEAPRAPVGCQTVFVSRKAVRRSVPGVAK